MKKIIPNNEVIMSQIINYPLKNDYSSNQEPLGFFREAEKIDVFPNEKAKKSFIINRQSVRQIKFSLGVIYFFSLIYFSIKLFT
jgi:hypothetical protein